MLVFLVVGSGGYDLSVTQCELIVFGSTPGGVAASVSAGNLGMSVCMVDRQTHVGGMTTNGIGKSDEFVKGSQGR